MAKSKWLERFLVALAEALAKMFGGSLKPPQDSGAPVPAPVKPESPAASTEGNPSPRPPTGDALDILTLSIGVKNCPGVTAGTVRNAAIGMKIMSARIEGEMLRTDFIADPWINEGGIVFFGVGERIEKFDYWRSGGQRVKTLKNLIEGSGYDTLMLPAKGTPCYTMVTSMNGKHRSNIAKVEWK